MSTQTILSIDRDSIKELSARRQEPEWVADLRTEALELASTLQLPQLEKTRIDRWNLDSYGVYKAVQQLKSLDELPEKMKEFLQNDTQPDNLLIQHNSEVIYSSLSSDLASQGVIFTDLQTALQRHSDLVQPYFMKLVNKDENLLTALHTALWSGGVFLYVPKNVSIDVPIQALFYNDDAEARFSPHVLIVAETNSSVTYVDNYVSEPSAVSLVQNGVSEVYVKAGAQVNFASSYDLHESVTGMTYRRATVDQDGQINWIIGEMSEGNTMSDTTSLLRGNGSTSDTKVINIASAEQKLNITTKAVHFGKSTDSVMETRAVMKDQATAIINGITKIEKGATGANGEQLEKILMLSPRARGDANPILLIDEDDVKAGHAASVGQVSAEQIFYLMSRGISREEATKLVIYGFLAPVVTEIPISKLQNHLQGLVERKLGTS